MPKTYDGSPSYAALAELVPQPGEKPVWQKIWVLWPFLKALDACPQEPAFHGEGDAGTHTRMVVEALCQDQAWHQLQLKDRFILFWAAVLHDIGKPKTTVHEEDGRITSRGHSRVGAQMARYALWHCQVPFKDREAICGIIEAHQIPFWLLERGDPKRLAIETSWRCRPDLLCIHAKADGVGRICEDQKQILENVLLSQALFEDLACLKSPFAFANDESRLAFHEKPNRDPYYHAHEDFRCQVTVMSGLPGAGKDTWIKQYEPRAPVVSLDVLRAEMKVKPTDNQGVVIQAAHERAREYLRAGKDFVWNATNITRQLRGKCLGLLRAYNARIRVVYIEPDPEKLFEQNRQRPDDVPLAVIERLANKLEPPMEWEAHEILRLLK